MTTGKTTKRAVAPSLPFKASEHLRSEADIAAYVEAMMEDGDARAVPVAEALGGTAALLDAFGLRLTVRPTVRKRRAA